MSITINQQAENVSEKERDSSSQSDENSNGKASPHGDDENDSQERYHKLLISKRLI